MKRMLLPFLSIPALTILTFSFLHSGLTGAADNDSPTIGLRGIRHTAQAINQETVSPSDHELKLKAVADGLDSHKLLYSGKVVTDKDPRLLEIPAALRGKLERPFTVAKEAPTIDFSIVPLKPQWLEESPVKVSKDISGYEGPWKTPEITNMPGPWTHWTQGAYDSRTGKFYTSAGDHAKYGARIQIIEYDPAAKKVSCLPEINRVLGRSKTDFADGKIHGWLDFYKSGDIEREHLWYITYWAKYPEPDEEDYDTGYTGGHIISHDVVTGDIIDYGVPYHRGSFPYHRVDTKRGMMYAVGMFHEFLAWNIETQTTQWAGYPPQGMTWWNRAIMIDETTGKVYTTNSHESDPKHHFISYDPATNRFSQLDCHMPPETSPAIRNQGEFGNMRCQTRHRGPDGLFWGITYGGELFSFDPDKETVNDEGVSWPHPQRYTCSMERSPGGRYLYYIPCAPRFHLTEASPIIQYDTVTDTIKVLAFAWPYYREKYGFTASQNFSLKLDDKGEKLFVVWNGGFIEHEVNGKDDTFGQIAIMLVHIPESERVE